MKEVHKIQLEVTAKKIIKSLVERGVSCYLWHKATTGSMYIRFDNPTIGSVRLSDHEGKSHLKYKYNILIGQGGRKGWRKDDNQWRYYAPVNEWKSVVEVIAKSAQYIKDNNLDYGRTYFVPEFKKTDKQS